MPECGRPAVSTEFVTHRANAMKKLGLHTSAELIRYALGRGIISSDT